MFNLLRNYHGKPLPETAGDPHAEEFIGELVILQDKITSMILGLAYKRANFFDWSPEVKALSARVQARPKLEKSKEELITTKTTELLAMVDFAKKVSA